MSLRIRRFSEALVFLFLYVRSLLSLPRILGQGMHFIRYSQINRFVTNAGVVAAEIVNTPPIRFVY